MLQDICHPKINTRRGELSYVINVFNNSYFIHVGQNLDTPLHMQTSINASSHVRVISKPNMDTMLKHKEEDRKPDCITIAFWSKTQQN